MLDEARPEGIDVLHDRRPPRSRSRIDHLVIAPTGVWVIDAKRFRKGQLEPRAVGKRKVREVRLYVGGRDKTPLIEAMQKQVRLVEEALEHSPVAGTPVQGALCFVGTEVGFFDQPYVIQDVHVTWSRYLLRPILAVPAGGDGLDGPARADVARVLADRFKRA